jgi:phosphatidylserine decarboxylase
VQDWQYDGSSALEFSKGQEMGRFNMGSTVVILLPPKAPQWLASLGPEQVIRLGQAMAK